MSAPQTVVFCGPTIGAGRVVERLGTDTLVLPPAAAGDVLRAARLRPRSIAVIDGYFSAVPAVWHKEILWAMAEGVHVFGAASMGALRAAELAAFGMEGVGRIFEWYRDGTVIRDDEVAVAHGPAEVGFRPASEALVNMRATLDAAVEAGVLPAEHAREALAWASGEFYPDRSWPALCDALCRHVCAESGSALRAFVEGGGRVDQKLDDALALLAVLDARRNGSSGPKVVPYTLSHTVWFDRLAASAGTFSLEGAKPASPAAPPAGSGAGRVAFDDVLDELRLAGTFTATFRAALLRRLTAHPPPPLRRPTRQEDLADFANEWCHELGLADQQAFEEWLVHNDLTVEQFNQLIEHEFHTSRLSARAALDVLGDIPDVLRVGGRWGAVRDRVAAKVRLLGDAGLNDPGLADTPFATVADLVAWWAAGSGAGTVGATDPSQPGEIGRIARRGGWDDSDLFVQALLREYCARALGLGPLDERRSRP